MAIKKFKESEDDEENVQDDAARGQTTQDAAAPEHRVVEGSLSDGRGSSTSLEFVSKNLLEVLENEVGGVGSDATCRYMLQLAQATHCCHSTVLFIEISSQRTYWSIRAASSSSYVILALRGVRTGSDGFDRLRSYAMV